MAFGTLDGDDDEVMSEINMTPLVDVMLVLLIIFIITIPVINHAVKIDLPRATNQPNDTKPQIVPPGPNNPVGVVWIDLSKEHYGIHGTADPEQIGRAESNGCIRLTNWDAARLSLMVKPGTPAVFQR